MLDLNVDALTRLMRFALPAMLARGEGGIINVASLGGLVPAQTKPRTTPAKRTSFAHPRSRHRERGPRRAADGVGAGPVNTGFHRAMGAELSFYRQLMIALSPAQTARAAYRGYVLGLHLVVPGITAKLLQIALWIIPHALLLPLIGWLLRRREERPWSGIHPIRSVKACHGC